MFKYSPGPLCLRGDNPLTDNSTAEIRRHCEESGVRFTCAPDSAQHKAANQAAERPHKEPVGTKLSAAGTVAAHYARLGRQDRSTVAAFADAEVPDGPSNSRRHGPIEFFAIERREIAGGPPKSARYSQDNFFSRLFGQHTESGVKQRLHRDFLISRHPATATHDEPWQGSQSQK